MHNLRNDEEKQVDAMFNIMSDHGTTLQRHTKPHSLQREVVSRRWIRRIAQLMAEAFGEGKVVSP